MTEPPPPPPPNAVPPPEAGGSVVRNPGNGKARAPPGALVSLTPGVDYAESDDYSDAGNDKKPPPAPGRDGSAPPAPSASASPVNHDSLRLHPALGGSMGGGGGPYTAYVAEEGDSAVAFWFGEWYPCIILKWVVDPRQQPQCDNFADLQWTDGTLSLDVPGSNVRHRSSAPASSGRNPFFPGASTRRSFLPRDTAIVNDPFAAPPEPALLPPPPLAAASHPGRVVVHLTPPKYRLFSVLLLVAAGAFFLAVMVLETPDENRGLWWAVLAAVLTAIVVQIVVEVLSRRERKQIPTTGSPHADRNDVQALWKECAHQQQAARRAMRDTAGEGLLAASLTMGKSQRAKLDTPSESKLPWGTKWKGMGETMPNADGKPVTVAFGAALRELYFLCGAGCLDGISHAATPLPVIDALHTWQQAVYRDPAAWRDGKLKARLRQVQGLVSSLVNSEERDTALVLSAESAQSAVLESLPWRVGDSLLVINGNATIHRSTKDTLRRRWGVETVRMDFEYPWHSDDMCRILRERLEARRKARRPMPPVAIMDHVSRETGHIIPARRLIDILHEFDISVYVDGSLAVGHIPVDVVEIGADWYSAALHTWVYACPGTAFLVAKSYKHRCTFPLATPHFNAHTDMSRYASESLFEFLPWLAAIDAWDFVINVCGGLKEAKTYCRQQAKDCVQILAEKWKTAPVQEEGYAALPVVPVPSGKHKQAPAAEKLSKHLWSRYRIDAKALVLTVAGVPTLCVRCTAQIYTLTTGSGWLMLCWH
ncbi:putative L-cysteine desulfhydrase 1 [Diplonema papillatum]|nr:putative L-cysteine desulfhydrase 1 [Diplonema papillatum]KAJ9460272.1 putative L-cysteine desulfhydrase 1 [Diplonema papillatum]